MKRNSLFTALALAMGLTLAGPVLAQSGNQQDQVNALKVLVEKQQQQLNQQQQDLQQLRDSLKKLEGEQTQAAAVAAAPAPKAAAPTFSSAPGIKVSMNGFISATAFSQDRSFVFGNGQNAEFPVAGAPSGSLSGVDVRSTRFWFDFSGAKFTDNWSGGGHIEMDFFGGYNGTGAFSQQQPLPRLRQAYMVLTNPGSGSTVKIGQQWDLMFPLDNVPNSLGHIAFPLGLGVGMVGWRFPGVVWSQDLNKGSTGAQWRLDMGAFSGSWDGPGNNVNYQTAANAGLRPQVEARLHVEDGDLSGYAVAHYAQINLAGVGGTAPTPIASTITSEAFEIGGSWHPGPWLFRGNVYTGNGLGDLFGGLLQFGDIGETGGFAQAGYSFDKNWSANAFYGYVKPNTSDVVAWMGHGASGLLRSRQTAVNLQYAAGAYELGLEWMYGTVDSTTNGSNRLSTDGNQVMLSALYHF